MERYRGSVGQSSASKTSPEQPGRLILTIYGAFGRDIGGALSAAHLVRLLGDLDIDEPSVRVALSRLKRRGLLGATTVDGAPGYSLTPASRQILQDGDRRIYGRGAISTFDNWLLVVFSIPEVERDRRHRLRAELVKLGFGTVTPGTWIAPLHLRDELLDALDRGGLATYVDLFPASLAWHDNPKAAIARWWDLRALQRMYREFLSVHARTLRRWERAGGSNEQAFVDYIRTLTAWRRLPYLDPGLPLDVLPAGWPGVRAQELFESIRSSLEDRARRHFAASRQPQTDDQGTTRRLIRRRS